MASLSPGGPPSLLGGRCGRGIREVSAQKAERNSASPPLPPAFPAPSPPRLLPPHSNLGSLVWCQFSPGRRRARKWPRSRSRRFWKSLVSRLLELTSCSTESFNGDKEN
ncbi:hypothetical protein PAL_GLEAN10024504 [Pteropus alecto]|uniref:Uncharacterized protein n=1 Tax=Pteropus alecto TaxID=9402 RepID=L5JXW3_PTEAL|nr:hypothetical protein PAL_GLEAN10024504 [Pteropus alecto]